MESASFKRQLITVRHTGYSQERGFENYVSTFSKSYQYVCGWKCFLEKVKQLTIKLINEFSNNLKLTLLKHFQSGY